jgi:hypothetical protein
MAMRPHIVHVVGYCEADHAARPEEVIESCRMARRSIEHALNDAPDMTADPAVQTRVQALRSEAMVIVDGIRALGSGCPGDPLLDIETLSRTVKVGLLDAPNLRGCGHACGTVRTHAVNGAIVAVNQDGTVVPESERVQRCLSSA